MSYETPEQKSLLVELQAVATRCAEARIPHGKALVSFNQGYGTERPQRSQVEITLRAGATERARYAARVSALQVKALILSRMTGEQVKLARLLPDEWASRIPDNSLVGDVFSLEQLEKIL